VQLITKKEGPPSDVKTFAQKVSEKLVKLPNAVQNLDKNQKEASKEVVLLIPEKTAVTSEKVVAGTKVPESTPEKSSIDNINLEQKLPTKKEDSSTTEVSVVRKRDLLLKIGISVLVDHEDGDLVEKTKLRLANFVATKSTVEDPLPDFYNGSGLSLQDLSMVLKMSKGFLPKINVVRDRKGVNNKKSNSDNNNQPEENQRKSEQQKNNGTIANSKRRSHGGGGKNSRSPKSKQKENERPNDKSKLGNKNTKNHHHQKSGKKGGKREGTNKGDNNKKPVDTKKSEKDSNGQSQEKSTPVLNEIAAN
jgi:hypothetical protein